MRSDGVSVVGDDALDEEVVGEEPAGTSPGVGARRSLRVTVLGALRTGRRWGAAALVVALGALLGLAAVRVVGAEDPLSIVDEHAHLDYALRVHDGVVPLRGMEYDQRVVDEWACGVGHEAGAPWTCGDPAASAATLPSGRYTSGYIHYPTYFVAADGFRRALDATGAQLRPLTAYRGFSAVCLVLGVVACAGAARAAGLRGSALVAAALAPSAGGSVLLFGVLVNPVSTAVLCGGLVAWAAVRWVRSGRGFWVVVAASALAAGTAVTSSLPVVAVGAAATFVWWRRRTGRRVDGPWRPHLGHVGLLAAVVLAPVVVWGRVIAARAVVPNAELYGAYPVPPALELLGGGLLELGPHVAWVDPLASRLVGDATVGALARGAAYAATAWLGPVVVVVAVLLLLGVVVVTARRTPGGEARDEPAASVAPASRWAQPAVALVAGTVLALVAHAPLLRISNALTMGIDHPVVARYALALSPLLVLGVLLALRDRRVDRLLATLAVVAVAGVGLGAL